jgi:hypothetical protein
MRRRPPAALAAGVLAAGLLAAGCSSSPSHPPRTTTSRPRTAASSGPPAPPAVRAEIGKAYAALFGTKSTIAQSVDSLQNGPVFKKVIVAESKTPQAKGSGAKVTAATMRSADLAKVTFTVFVNGTAELPNAPGYAVRQDGKWKVAAQTFCQLLTLSNNAPKACNDPKITALPR